MVAGSRILSIRTAADRHPDGSGEEFDDRADGLTGDGRKRPSGRREGAHERSAGNVGQVAVSSVGTWSQEHNQEK